MSDFVFNIAKGKWARYAESPGANGAFIAVPIEATGLEADATLKDYATLSAILTAPATNNEQTTMGRITLTGVTITTDNANDKNVLDCNDIVWAAATGNAVGAILVCFDPDKTVVDDTVVVPVAKYDFAVTPNGSDITATVAATGLAVAS